MSTLSDRAAVQELITTFTSYRSTAAILEWEFRFSSFRVHNPRYQFDFFLLFDEYESAIKSVQRFGWKLKDRPQQFKRWVLPLSKTSPSGKTRITEESNGQCLLETKTPYLSTSTEAMNVLLELFHTRVSFQLEKVEGGLTQQEIRSRRDAAVHNQQTVLRKITRTTFVHPLFPCLQLDFSDVIMMDPGKTSRRNYEIELEVVSDGKISPVAQHIVDAIRQVVMGIQFGKTSILSGPSWKGIMMQVERCLGQCNMRFPQPVSITPLHVQQLCHGEFAVTEKADGKRCLLYLFPGEEGTKKKELFRVDFFGRVISLGMSLPDSFFTVLSSCLMDCEYIPEKNLYLIFDLYFYEGTTDWFPVSDEIRSHLSATTTSSAITFHALGLQERYQILHSLLAKCAAGWTGKGKDSVRLQLKNMIFPSGREPCLNRAFFEFLSQIVRQETTFDYRVEGLIFTNIKAPLPSLVGTTTTTTSLSQSTFHLPLGNTLPCIRWNGAVKWKVPEETTNDFQLGKFEWDEDSHTLYIPLLAHHAASGQYVLFEGVLPEDPLGAKHSFLILEHQESITRREVLSPSFAISVGSLSLQEGLIIECAFDMSKVKWKPIRARPDKRFPNSVDVVYANWELIHSPTLLPLTIQQAEEFIHRDQPVQETYYRDSGSSDRTTASMREFHNAIKRLALHTCLHRHFPDTGRKVVVLDMAIGRGGDLYKYMHESARIKRVIGIDWSASNLELCCRRFLQISVGTQSATPFSLDLVHGSSAWPLDNARSWNEQSTFQYSTATTSPILTNQLPARESVDIVTLHFALHYFWKEERELDGLVDNLDFAIPVGGMFLATCFDGLKVYEFFRTNSTLTLTDAKGNVYLQIRPRYASPQQRTYGEEDCFGFPLEVFNRSINASTVNTEWLVHPDLFQRKMEHRGFRAIPLSEFFGRDCPDFIKPLGRLDQHFWHLYLKWKLPISHLTIPTDQLTTACGWNRLFVFQRMSQAPIGPTSSLLTTSAFQKTTHLTLHSNVRMPAHTTSIKFQDTVHLHPSNYFGLTLKVSEAKQFLFSTR